MNRLNRFALIEIEYSNWNGFVCSILTLEHDYIGYRSLFRLDFGYKSYLHLDIFFINVIKYDT